MSFSPYLQVGLELKSLSAAGVFAGYASVFGVIDSQRDIVEAGAFAEAVKQGGRTVKLLWQHDPKQPIGFIRALKEDALGLYMEAQLLLETAVGREAYALLKAGAVKGLSIGFTPVKHRFDAASGVRHLQQVRLWEISLVTFPANEAANVTVVKGATPVPPAPFVPVLPEDNRPPTGPQALKLSAALERVLSVLRS